MTILLLLLTIVVFTLHYLATIGGVARRGHMKSCEFWLVCLSAFHDSDGRTNKGENYG